MAKPTALLIIGDFHAGSKVSLCPEEGVALDDGDLYHPNRAQKALWNFFSREFIPWIKQKAKGYRLVVDDGGDGIDGATHHGSLQTFGTNADAEELHIRMIEPITNMADDIIYVRGTRAHVGLSSESDVRLARRLGVLAHWRYQKEIDGKLLDIRHHASTGRRAWTRGTSLHALMRHEYFTALEKRERIPNVVVRHHVHMFDALTDFRMGITGILAPGWKMTDEYGSAFPIDAWECGGAMYFFDTGRVEHCLFKKKNGHAG